MSIIYEKKIKKSVTPIHPTTLIEDRGILGELSVKNFLPSDGISHGASKTIFLMKSSFFLL